MRSRFTQRLFSTTAQRSNINNNSSLVTSTERAPAAGAAVIPLLALGVYAMSKEKPNKSDLSETKRELCKAAQDSAAERDNQMNHIASELRQSINDLRRKF